MRNVKTVRLAKKKTKMAKNLDKTILTITHKILLSKPNFYGNNSP